MQDVFSLLFSIITGFITFLDSFEILNGVSFLKIVIVLILFYIGFQLLSDNKKE